MDEIVAKFTQNCATAEAPVSGGAVLPVWSTETLVIWYSLFTLCAVWDGLTGTIPAPALAVWGLSAVVLSGVSWFCFHAGMVPGSVPGRAAVVPMVLFIVLAVKHLSGPADVVAAGALGLRYGLALSSVIVAVAALGALAFSAWQLRGGQSTPLPGGPHGGLQPSIPFLPWLLMADLTIHLAAGPAAGLAAAHHV